MLPFLDRIFNRRTSDPNPDMSCPFCHQPMEARTTHTELFVDGSGHGVYECRNDLCSTKPRYRRVDRELESILKQQEMAKEQQRMSQAAEVVSREEVNRLTVWLRENKPEYLGKGWQSSVDIAIYLMSGGRESLPGMKADGGKQGGGPVQ